MAGEFALDGRDAVLADAEGVVAAEGEGGVRGVEMHVGDGEEAGEAGDLDGVVAGVGVGVALEDPGLVEGVHGAPLGFAVDAEVVGDVGVDGGAYSGAVLRIEMDVPFVLGVRGGNEEVAAVGVRDDDLGVDPEGHHDVFRLCSACGLVVEVAEVGEVAGVVDGDGGAGGGEGLEESLGGDGFVTMNGDYEGRGVVEAVGGEAIEGIGEALGVGVFGSEGVGAVAAGDAIAERGDEAGGGEGWKGGWLVERDGLRGGEGVGAEVEVLADLGGGG